MSWILGPSPPWSPSPTPALREAPAQTWRRPSPLHDPLLRDLSELHDLADLDESTYTLLDAYHFAPGRFAELRRRLVSGSLSPHSNLVSGTLEPPRPSDLTTLPRPDSTDYRQVRTLGLAALQAGEVAAIILAGRTTDRFADRTTARSGSRATGVVEALDGRSFLQIKLDQIAAITTEISTEPPCVIVTSFATDLPSRKNVAARSRIDPSFCTYSVSLRLIPDGALLRTRTGRPSPYIPGNGDLLLSLRRSGTLEQLRSRGVRYLMVSDVDNLAATLDPVVLGMHIASERPITAEVAASTGGTRSVPVVVDRRTELVEDLRLPTLFDRRSLPVTSIGTLTLDLSVMRWTYPLTWLYVEKIVQGRAAAQFERRLGELSTFLPTTYLLVPGTGAPSRSVPVRPQEDLTAAVPHLREVLRRPALG